MTKVSVIIPVYNAAEHLRECLDSICGQTLRDIEIICIDDGSKDQSLEILQEYANKDLRLKIIIQENSGAGAARNRGLKIATGECLSFLDADDFFELDMLENAYEEYKRCQADIVVFNSDQYQMNIKQFVSCDWTMRKKDIPPYMPFTYRELTGNIFLTFVGWAWDKIFNHEFVKKNGLQFQEQRTTNDMLFVFSALVSAKKISIIDKTLAHHRIGNGQALSVTREKSWHCFYDALYALREFLQERNIYWELEQDFVNYALHFSLWNFRTLKDPIKSKLKEKLCLEWFEDLGISKNEKAYFYNQQEYDEYKKITININSK